MTIQDIIRKLTSRKLWLAIGGVAYGVALSLGADASDIKAVAGAVAALVSAVSYIYVEGKVDAARVKNAAEAAQEAADALTK